jgi:glycosyltransferase involved in cell wall biosynthesis
VFNVDNFDWRQKFNDSGKIRIVALSDSRKYKAFPVLAEIIRNTKAVMKDRIEWTLFGFYNPGDIGCDYKYAGTLFKRELADLYRTAHIVVMPSWCDSFAIPPIEGMACGALGVCIESGSEDYGINGKNCLVFKPMDIDGISEGIIKAASLKSGIEDIVAEGIKTSLEFSIDKRTDVYVDIFNKIRKSNVSERFKDINDMVDGVFYS